MGGGVMALEIITPAVALVEGHILYALMLAAGFLIPRSRSWSLTAHNIYRLGVGLAGLMLGLFWYAVAGAFAMFAYFFIVALVQKYLDLGPATQDGKRENLLNGS